MFIISVNYFEVGDAGFGMIIGHTVLVNYTGDMDFVFFNSILQASAELDYVGKVDFFLDRNICRQCFVSGVMGFSLWTAYGWTWGVGSFEDDLHTGMSEVSSEFLT